MSTLLVLYIFLGSNVHPRESEIIRTSLFLEELIDYVCISSFSITSVLLCSEWKVFSTGTL